MTPYINRGMKLHWFITRITVVLGILRALGLFAEGISGLVEYNLIAAGIYDCALSLVSIIVEVMIFANRKQYNTKVYYCVIGLYALGLLSRIIVIAAFTDAETQLTAGAEIFVYAIWIIILLVYYNRRKEIFALNIPVSEAGVINNETRNKIKKELQIIYDFNDPTIYTDYQEDLEKPINESPFDENALQSEENCADESQSAVIPIAVEDDTSVDSISTGDAESINESVLESKVSFKNLCYKCGKLYPEDGKFCPFCGAEYKEKQVEASNTKFCIYCGATLPMDARFCRSCGKKQPTED